MATQGFAYGTGTLTGQSGSLVTALDTILNTGDATNGWQIAFTGTNARAYRPRVGLRNYLQVNDNLGAGATQARIRMYEAMTAVATGTSPFPLTTQHALVDGVIHKSDTNDATARNYRYVRTSRFVLLWIDSSGGGTYTTADFYAFGDFPSYVGSDAYNALFMAQTTANSATSFFISRGANFAGLSSTARLYLMRSSSGVTKSVTASLHGISGQTTNLGEPATYPLPRSARIPYQPLNVLDTNTTDASGVIDLRGRFPMLHVTPFNAGVNDGDTVTIDGKNFVACRHQTGAYVAFLQTNDPDNSAELL